MSDIVERLRSASVGHPYAKIPWPHRILHEAADEIERLRALVGVDNLAVKDSLTTASMPAVGRRNVDNLDVVTLNRGMGVAILTDGQGVTITHWFDAEGHDCDASDAVKCVCGPDQDDNWYVVDLTSFMDAEIQ